MPSPFRVLFVCSMNKWRSPTAERMFRDNPRLEVRSAGLRKSAVRPLAEDDLVWAELVLVMEREHKREIHERFGSISPMPRIEVLDVPDDYQFMDPELQRMLQLTAGPLLDAAVESSREPERRRQNSG